MLPEQRLRVLEKLRQHIDHLVETLILEQKSLIQDLQGSEYDIAIAIIGLLKTGARVRWGYHGWQIESIDVAIPCEIMNGLQAVGLVEGDDNGVVTWKSVRRKNSPPPALEGKRGIVEDLLCERWTADLDRFSRVVLRYQQKRAFLVCVAEMRALYSHLLENRTIRDYRASLSEIIRWNSAVGGLYLCATLHFLGVGSKYRGRLAQHCLTAMEQVVPGLLN